MDALGDNPFPELLALADTLPEPRMFIGADYRVLAVSRAWREVFGNQGEVVGRFCYEISHRADRPCDQMGETCPLKSSRANGEPARSLHIHHTPRGTEHVDVEVSPIRDAAGQALFYVESMRMVRRARSQPSAEGLVGCAPTFNRMLELIERVAPSEATVLLLGESGVGKELAAQAVHEASTRAQGPFIAVDCAGMTEMLAGSELFGHEKGAFTGAVGRKIGLVEAAAGGTLFIDEVGDIPLCLQVKLLRLIESGTYRRVGGLEPLRANFRLVLATHRNLDAMVDEGSFRRDLYYRISAFPIDVPPLRERIEDLPILVESLLARVGRRRLRLHPDALERLAGHAFPGNIRELRNLIERAALLADSDTILPEHLPEKLGASRHRTPVSEEIVSLAEAERRYLRWAVARHKESRHALASLLGISPRSLFRKLRGGEGEAGAISSRS